MAVIRESGLKPTNGIPPWAIMEVAVAVIRESGLKLRFHTPDQADLVWLQWQ